MQEIAKKHIERLPDLKKKVEEAYSYFDDNVRRFHEFTSFVFKSSLNSDEATALQEIGRPSIEFNILEAYISRLRGEFAKQQPSLSVRAADGVPIEMLTEDFNLTLEVVESHLRSIFFDGCNDKLEYNVYSDLLAGGFSVLRVYTDYVNEMSFEQNIYVERAFDPTLCGFDPLARESHKGDGKFCFELYPMTLDAFEEEFGKDAGREMRFTRDLAGFGWSYKNGKKDIVLVCDFYEKQCKDEIILKLSNGHSVTQKEYENFKQEWDSSGRFEQIPLPVKTRKTSIEKIVRYRFCENKMLKHDVTSFKHLPLVFVDGNSINLTEGQDSYQMTKPYVYHAKGIQRLKNFAGQSLGNELENTVQHKFIVAVESVPPQYLDAYDNVQKADTLMYNHFLDKTNPEVILPPPREVVRTPIPPQITETFRMSDEMTQTILGSYDGAAGVSNAPLSGIAFARSAIQSNNASVPFLVGYIKGLNRTAQIIVDLIPKYYRTPRSLPILLPNGERKYMEINKKGSLYMNYDPNTLQVKVEIGVNFAMQKEIALQTVISLSQSMPVFADFFGKKGLQVLLDNIDIRGIEGLKEKALEYEAEMKQQQQQAMQMQQQQSQQAQQMQQMSMMQAQKKLQTPTKEEIDLMRLQNDSQVDAADMSIKARNSEIDFIETMAKIRMLDVDAELEAERIDAENERSQVEALIAVSKHINEASI